MSRGVHIQHIGQKERRAFLLDGIGQKPQRFGNVGPVVRRLELNDFPDDAEEMAASLAGRYEFLYLVAEEQGSDLVIVYDGGE